MTATLPAGLAAFLALPAHSLSRIYFEALQTKLDQLQTETGDLQSKYTATSSRSTAIWSRTTATSSRGMRPSASSVPKPGQTGGSLRFSSNLNAGFWPTREERPPWSPCSLLSSG